MNIGARPCACGCHSGPGVLVVCCGCYRAGVDPCECGEPRRCCGDPPPNPNEGLPDPPGWRQGDEPPDDPLAGATDDRDLQRRLRAGIIDLLRTSDLGKGPGFGPRSMEYLPYLVVRAFAGDHGARPVSFPQVNWWETPDLFVAPDLTADAAPAVPPTHTGTAKGGKPNALWAHVWNLGLAPVTNARVEFWHRDANIGWDTGGSLIGVTYVDLGSRTSGRAHTFVKCPVTFVPPYVAGSHQCMLVRCFEPLTDPYGADPWNALKDRHIAQRNLTVVEAASPARLSLRLLLGCAAPQGPATVTVESPPADGVTWLAKLAAGGEERLREAARPAEVVGLMGPFPAQAHDTEPDIGELPADVAERLLRRRIDFERGCDELEVLLYVSVDGLEPGECKVYRVTQTMQDTPIGGYTVIVRKSAG